MKNKIDFFQIISLSVAIIILSLIFAVLPDKEISDKENRTLANFPSITVDNILSGKFSQQFSSYIADQFPFRDTFVSAKAQIELLLGKRENSGVIKAKNDILIPKSDADISKLNSNLMYISNFSEKTSSNVTIVALPRSIDVFNEFLPKSYPYDYEENLWREFNLSLNRLKLDSVSVFDELCDNNLYYRTDHHFTSDGAYAVYKILADKLGYTAYKSDFFEKKIVASDFCGTSMRKSGFYSVKKDIISVYTYKNDDKYIINADGKAISLYDFDKLNTTDKYSMFLGGNHARVDIKSSGNPREQLLVIRDSFADSLAPFLALHYDLIYIDLRYYNKSVTELIRNERINNVLFFESIEEFSNSQNFSKLMIE